MSHYVTKKDKNKWLTFLRCNQTVNHPFFNLAPLISETADWSACEMRGEEVSIMQAATFTWKILEFKTTSSIAQGW